MGILEHFGHTIQQDASDAADRMSDIQTFKTSKKFINFKNLEYLKK